MYQYYVLYLPWWWLNKPKHVAEFLILITNIWCVYWLNKLVYYCKTQRDDSYQSNITLSHQCWSGRCQLFWRIFIQLHYLTYTFSISQYFSFSLVCSPTTCLEIIILPLLCHSSSITPHFMCLIFLSFQKFKHTILTITSNKLGCKFINYELCSVLN